MADTFSLKTIVPINQKFLLFALFIALFPSLIPLAVIAPWLIALLGLAVGILIINFIEKEEDREFLLKLFIYAYLLRILLAFILHIGSLHWEFNPGFFIDDGWGYSENGKLIAGRLERGLPIDHAIIRFIEGSRSGALHEYDYINGIVYFLAGRNPLNILFLNCAMGALSSIFMYLIVMVAFGNRQIARLSTLLCTFWPSLVLWSTQNLKEALTIFLIILCFWAFISLIKSFNPLYPMVAFFSIFCLWKFRLPIAQAIIISIFLHLIFLVYKAIKPEPPTILAILLIGFFVLFKFLAISLSQITDILAKIDVLRGSRATANLAILPGYRMVSSKALLLYIPIGFIALLFSPFPWQLFSASQIMAAPEMLVWYLMFPCTVKGLIFIVKNKTKYFFSIFTFIILVSSVMIVVEGNMGTMFRHKSLIMIFFLVFMATGIIGNKQRNTKVAT